VSQVLLLAQRSVVRTLRQPAMVFPSIFFPLLLLAINSSGLNSATKLPGFPTDSYFQFAIAIPFIQGALFSAMSAGTNVANVAFLVVGIAFGEGLAAGPGGVPVLILLSLVISLAFGCIGAFVALRTGNGEAVQGVFPLFFAALFLSSMSLPRDLIETDWYRTVATYNPVSYMLEGIRSLFIAGWDAEALALGFACAGGIAVIAMVASSAALRTRMVRT
jgi:ABC-2 type transport system permease protein